MKDNKSHGGQHLTKPATLVSELLQRADPRHIRDKRALRSTVFHRSAMGRDRVLATAGAHDAVFAAKPQALLAIANAIVANLAM